MRVWDRHTEIILARYAKLGTRRAVIPKDVLVKTYLSKAMHVAEVTDKIILEIGAGCSPYVELFLEAGCRKYYANELVPERLWATRVTDPRWIELPGDFRGVDVPERVDIVFASLTMMCVVPYHEEFVSKISSILRPGGVFLSMDANFLCPLSIARRFLDRNPNPVRLFSPFRYSRLVEAKGMKVEKLVPFTGPAPWVTGNWLLGTTFFLRARKL